MPNTKPFKTREEAKPFLCRPDVTPFGNMGDDIVEEEDGTVTARFYWRDPQGYGRPAKHARVNRCRC